jgi:hypothetical protein
MMSLRRREYKLSDDLFTAQDSGYIEPKEGEAAPMTKEVSIPMTSDGFIKTVLSQPDSAEKVQLLRELIAMQNAERERVCKENFDTHFAELRKALAPVVKTRVNSGTSSKYAALEDLQGPCDPIIFDHGFTYSWDEEALAEGRKCVIMYIYGYGYTKTIRWEAPHFDGNRATNPLQSAGVQSSYGQRYTYKGGFGIVLKGEDNDAQSFDLDEVMATAKPLAEIKAATSLNDLGAKWTAIYNEYKSDDALLALLIKAKDMKKKELAK